MTEVDGIAFSGAIRWPAGHAPEGARVFVQNAVEAPNASPEAVWAWLIRAARWSEWYANCKRLRFEEPGAGPDLALGTAFRWWTFGVPVRTVVEEFEPGARLAWSGTATGSWGYHAWLLEPNGRGGTRILTEETQRGLIPTVAGWFLRPRMLHMHQRWLEGLATQATAGPPR